MIVESASNVWKASFQVRAGAILGLLAAVLAIGCGGVPKTYFYTLQVPSAPAPNDPKTNYVLGVEHFRTPEILRDDRIVYFVSSTQINFFQYHRRGSDPATLLSDYTAHRVASSGVVAQVEQDYKSSGK
ncbi:MAG: ABC-type transport auxiliary lipoprotein family protein [Acidobacteriota bacterium]|nr:ABC-type transport auxiliary lipoprotein family protein [Acidobacteriota bacterium]